MIFAKRSRHREAIVILWGLGAVMAHLASGDDQPPPVESVVSLDIEVYGWKFTSAVNSGELRGLVAQILPELAYPGNLDVLWFEPDGTGTWSAWGWNEPETLTNAVGWIRAHLEDDTVFSENPRIQSLAPTEPGSWLGPVRLSRGLLEDHPLQLVLGEAPRSSQLFETLEQAGWGVAPVISRLSEADYAPGASAGVSLQQLLWALGGKTLALVPGTIAQVGSAPTVAGPDFPWDCSCTTAFGLPSCGPWVPSNPPASHGQSGGTVCHWQRTCTTPWRTSGDFFLSCIDCRDTGTYSVVEYERTTEPPGAPCVPPP